MPKSELKSSASEDENNVTEENEISDDEYLSDFTKLQPHEYKPCVSEESKIKLTRKRIIRFRNWEILSGILVVNPNQWLLMQKAFDAWINMKFVKVISKLFHSFLKCF